MSLLFHPATLEILKNFKTNPNIQDLVTLIPLILDNTGFIDLEYLHFIIFSNCSLSSNELKKLKNGMRRVIEKCFIRAEHAHSSEGMSNGHLDFSGSGLNYICLLKTLKNYEYSDLLIDNRRNAPASIGNMRNTNLVANLPDANREGRDKNDSLVPGPGKQKNRSAENENSGSIMSSQSSSMDISFFRLPKKTKKGPAQSNTLNFVKTKDLPHKAYKKFAPLDLSSSHFVYNRDSVSYETQRKRDDLVNPVQLQFIKFHGQAKPPIYQKRGELARSMVSYVKIPEVILYDDSSSEEWMSVDETVTTEIEESSERSEGGNDEEWIEKDSDDVEITKFSKKPNFMFKQVNVETYFEVSKYLRCPLFETAEFPDFLRDELLESCRSKNTQEAIESFSREYLVGIRAVEEEVRKCYDEGRPL